jgi:putative phosphoesterase
VTTTIGLISDLHATAAPVREALAIFKDQGVDMSLCAGDIAGYGSELDKTVELLMQSNCKAIVGNHELWYLEDFGDKETQTTAYFRTLPAVRNLTVEGKELYMVHASPPRSDMDGIILLDENENVRLDQKQKWTERLTEFTFDVLVVGHTHQVFAEQLGNTLVVNPGSTKFNHTCAILRLPELEFQLFALSNRSPQRVWRWGANQE